MKKMIQGLTIILLLTNVIPVFAEDSNILATNTWTAAFAELAGIDSVEALAPATMVHPPEYELRASDIQKINQADLLIFAGYEVLMETVFDSLGKPEEDCLKITTSYVPALLRSSVLAIAERAGTTAIAEQRLAEVDSFFAEARESLQEQGLYGKKILVHFHQKPLMTALGFEILGTYGPEPPEVRQIIELSELNPDLIIDNEHNPVADPLTEMTGAPTAALVNFPGTATRTDSLLDVLEYNLEQILLLKE